MTYLQILNLIKDTALAQPNVNTVVREFIDLNREDTKYSAVVIQDRDGTRDRIVEQDYITYTWHLGYVDRLTYDESNRDDIFSTGMNVITNIMNSIRDSYFPILEVRIIDRFNTFNQRFTASCAGVYVVLAIDVAVSDCVDGEQLDMYDKYEARITENGSYHFIPDGRPVNDIEITVEVSGTSKPEETLTETITSNGSYHYDPTPGSVFSEADITVSVPETVLKTYQGSFDVSPSSGNIFLDPSNIGADGFSSVAIEIGVMTNNVITSITSNGSYRYEVGDQTIGDAYINVVDLDIDVHPSDTLSRRYTTNGVKTITGEFNGGTVTVDVHPSASLSERYTSNGVYAIDGEFNGGEVMVDVHPSVSLTRTFTSNDTYSISGEWKDAEITVAVSAAKPEETLTETITSNGSYHYEPSAGSVFSEADITVDCPGPKEEQSLVEEISENGHFEWHPDPGKVFSDTEIFVDVHPSSRLVETITSNGTTSFSGEWSGADITVDVPTTVTVTMTQAEYDALAVKDPNTIYLINS